MPDDGLRHPERLLKGLRHSRRFEDRPVPLAVMDDLLAAGRGVGEARLLVIDDLVSIQDLGAVGTFAQSVAGATAVIVVTRDGKETSDDASLGSRVADAVMLAAHRHGLGAGYAGFGTAEAQATAREILGVPPATRVLVAVGVGYIDDDPTPQGSSLERVQATLEWLSGNRERRSEPGSS